MKTNSSGKYMPMIKFSNFLEGLPNIRKTVPTILTRIFKLHTESGTTDQHKRAKNNG